MSELSIALKFTDTSEPNAQQRLITSSNTPSGNVTNDYFIMLDNCPGGAGIKFPHRF